MIEKFWDWLENKSAPFTWGLVFVLAFIFFRQLWLDSNG